MPTTADKLTIRAGDNKQVQLGDDQLTDAGILGAAAGGSMKEARRVKKICVFGGTNDM
jgi:hypothetical protein